MVYHIENWEYVRDKFRTDPGLAKNLILRSLESTLVHIDKPDYEEDADSMIANCKHAESKEGFEGCIVAHGDIHESFNQQLKEGKGETFDSFLRTLEANFKSWKNWRYEKNRV